MPLIQIPGGQLEYSVAGSGRPACLTHQYTGVAASGPLPDMLTPHVTLHAINARGIGESGPVREPADLGMHALADDMEAARLALGLPPWVVVGASTGGMVALTYATRHPAGLAGLVLVGTGASHRTFAGSIYDPAHPRAAEMQQAQKALASGTPEGAALYRRTVWNLSVRDPEHTPRPAGMRSEFSTKRLAAFVNELPRFDLEAAISQIHVPTLVVVGRYDTQAPPENSRRLADAIPSARLVLCEQSGHFPYVEEPETFRAAIDQFLRESGLAKG